MNSACILRVLVDQLAAAPCVGTYLPTSDDPIVAPVLQALKVKPGDTRTLAELTWAANTTERTLMRRCQRGLGMLFAEWRQRLRIVNAMDRPEAGHTAETIALDSGYGSASAFITIFRRMVGTPPDEFRRAGGLPEKTRTMVTGELAHGEEMLYRRRHVKLASCDL